MYLVRWKFAANSLLNNMDVETHWYQQFHSNKKAAVDHYVTLLAILSMGMTVEIFKLVQLVPGEPEPEDVAENPDEQIMNLFNEGYTRVKIAELLNLSYSTVCKVVRRLSDAK